MKALVNDRIDVRISREHKELIKTASEISGFKNLSEFIIFCAKTEANRIISENDRFLRSTEDKRIFVEAILNPPAPGSQLKKALLNYDKFNGDDNNRS
ncbi:hypothetical protein DYBT9623_00573 [Dyadobacter sp. CECT 9623]|uniref:DUF1778 domain-containing protein n=1 Tax=Dyadobacter linearis TaxID=2823330 RepID=A0ABM8UK67_9BACT|nr:DUF1778 domain-containing protein [Dyadobacter sp. CECT 9623]CAG5067846.1 hypothetical protein DYBT9623_00573 [Dyadobacter sp. CECT 9623]